MAQRLIVLVGCVKSKREGYWPASQLYCGPLWEARWELAQALAPDEVWILSARYGPLRPDQEVESYEQRLARPDALWAWRVWEALKLEGRQEKALVLFLAGKPYRHYLAAWLREAGYQVIEGLAHVRGYGNQITLMRQAAELARRGDREAALAVLAVSGISDQ